MNIEELKELISLLPDREQEDLCVSIMAKKSRNEAVESAPTAAPWAAASPPRSTAWCAPTTPPVTTARSRRATAPASRRVARTPMPTQQEEDRDYAEFVQHYHNPDGAPEVIQSTFSDGDNDYDDDNAYEEITVDGVEYQRNTDDNTMIRRDDFSHVGIWNTGTGKIDFGDEEEGGGGIKKKKTKKKKTKKKKNKKKKKKKLSKKKKK
jgi:hypothetical protein